MGAISVLTNIVRFTFLFSLLVSPDTWEIRECEEVATTIKQGQYCWIQTSKLRPSQFTVGDWEVRYKSDQLSRHSSKQLERAKGAKYVPANISPEGTFYIFNGHHFAKAIHDSTLHVSQKWVYVRVENNWSGISMTQFHENLITNNYSRLIDAQGVGPLDPVILPKKLSDLQNDPFRSLASVAKTFGCYKTKGEESVPFEEYYWADLFRKHLMVDLMRHLSVTPNTAKWCKIRPFSSICMKNETVALEKILRPALRLCESDYAAGLPGYKKGDSKILQATLNGYIV